MKLFVAVTDQDWFNQLQDLRPDEVNFWRPSGAGFQSLSLGEPLLFKLHSPLNYIAGVGFFVSYSRLPISLAWQAFGEKNGVGNLVELKSRVRKYHGDSGGHDPNIGCIILTQPRFFPREEWIPCPPSFARNIVQGKAYDTSDADGQSLWVQVEKRLAATGLYGSAFEARGRLGQGAFRILVTDAYHRRCSITGERTLPVLEAAHIKSFREGPNTTSNGMLLRADLHNLFDRGLLTVTPEYRIEVSRRIRDDYGNGREYYAMHGRPLTVLPDHVNDQPRQEYLEWHNQYVYER